ncbi:HK97 family phage prohead protease [Rhodomicrobium vannielii ATCC 17100]|uniref:HK97 family phage prohead protease n=1 Tax=Rhodomicrobium vannielii TaxID=1069 RepID=UPI00191AE282|nr:HK97 family phage prohead protease [Rhodomicrobium vannielii]MBJ7535437.1 HK97 family phage prohead protease [Rhodomicrobium vannielii ATCC 17100]
MERRASLLEMRARGRRLEGYAATYGTEARIGDFLEVIAPGAFRDTIKGRDILAMVDHDSGRVLGRTRSGTLRLSEDSKGLAFDLDLPQTMLASDILALAERGDLGGMSFAFTIPTGGEAWHGQRRTLSRVTLHEISVVSAWPAYDGTTVAARGRLPVRLAMAKRWLETVR